MYESSTPPSFAIPTVYQNMASSFRSGKIPLGHQFVTQCGGVKNIPAAPAKKKSKVLNIDFCGEQAETRGPFLWSNLDRGAIGGEGGGPLGKRSL